MLKQSLVLREYGKDVFRMLAKSSHTFLFPLRGTFSKDDAESIASELMYHISMNLANEFLELNWGDWALVNKDTVGSLIGTSEEGSDYYLVGFVLDRRDSVKAAKGIDAFLAQFIPGQYINYGRCGD